MGFLRGNDAEVENVSTLRPNQEALHGQSVRAAQGRGAGGAFGDVADYYRNNLSDNPADFNAFAAPAIRQYHQDIVPGLSEQFAGMGSGGLSSSGFRNAQVQGATDLSERLGALRAQLRQQSAQGLMQIGQQGLQSYSQPMVTQESSPGFLQTVAPAVGTAAGAFFGGPAGAYAGYQAANSLGGNNVGANSNPYAGGNYRSSPQIYNA